MRYRRSLPVYRYPFDIGETTDVRWLRDLGTFSIRTALELLEHLEAATDAEQLELDAAREQRRLGTSSQLGAGA